MEVCVTCEEEIPEGTERKWGKKFKCDSCMKSYNAAKTARNREKERGPEWKPKSTPRHAMLECDGAQHRCTGCNEVKAVIDFPNNPETPCGYDPRCKLCRHLARRARMGAVKENPHCLTGEERTDRRIKKEIRFRLKWTYNISEDAYNWLAFSQDYVCYLCEESDCRTNKEGLTYNLSVDHDHRCCSGNKSCGSCVRHLLCVKCNTLVGTVESKPKLAYLLSNYVDLRPLDNYPGEGNW
jgi:hypothetical protein